MPSNPRGDHNGRYVLKDREPIPCADLLEWAGWMETHGRECHVASSTVGPVYVMTYFLGLDFALTAGCPPRLFETTIMAIDRPPRPSITGTTEDDLAAIVAWDRGLRAEWGELHDFQERYSTFAAAEEGHQRAIEFATAWLREHGKLH